MTVPIGTALREVIARAGRITTARPFFVNGGPMMGKLLDLARPAGHQNNRLA